MYYMSNPREGERGNRELVKERENEKERRAPTRARADSEAEAMPEIK